MEWAKLATESEVEDEEKTLLEPVEVTYSTNRSMLLLYKALLLMSIAVNLLFIVALVYKAGDDSPQSQLLYSPAQEAVKYEVRKFHKGFNEDVTVYQQDPSPEVDKAWNDLYNDIGQIRLPKSEAKLLPNKTYPILGDDGYYMAQLAVFHQLHCINIIRTALWKDHYMNIHEPSDFEYHWGAYGMRHVMHCIDALRQAIECASDISVVVWQWSDISQKALGHGDIVHTCRNFDSIRNWSAKHKFIGEFRPEVFIADDL